MQQGISQLYKMRNRFIIIGVTGKTGSGCTTVADIFSKERHNLDNLDAFYENKESKREWNILKNFYIKNWKKFYHIRVKDIISTFILESNYEEAKNYIYDKFDIDIIEFRETYKNFYEKNKILNNFLTDSNALLYTPKDPNEQSRVDTEQKEIKNFILEEIQKFSDEFKIFLNNHDEKYTKIYQTIGDNIRKSGCAFKECKDSFEHIFSLARRINTIIKIIRRVDKRNDEKNNKSLFIIDAFRNPNEVHFFRERYSAFYLMAVNCAENERRLRLSKLDIKESIINEINKKEYSNKNFYDTYSEYVGQNIKACINMSDLYINNFESKDSHYTELTSTIIRYALLIQHPGLVKPTVHEFLMQIAVTAATNSGCLSRQVGAVVTDENFEPLGIGWNCVPKNQVPCHERNMSALINHTDYNAYSTFEYNDDNYIEHIRKRASDIKTIKDYGLLDCFCFKSEFNEIKKDKNQVHTRALHAEENSILQCIKHGYSNLSGGYIFTSASPCVLCAKKICQMGIKEVFYMDPYPDISEAHIFGYGTTQIKMTLFTGAVGLAFHKLYTPLLPMKDEIRALTARNWKEQTNSAGKPSLDVAAFRRPTVSNPLSGYLALFYKKILRFLHKKSQT